MVAFTPQPTTFVTKKTSQSISVIFNSSSLVKFRSALLLSVMSILMILTHIPRAIECSKNVLSPQSHRYIKQWIMHQKFRAGLMTWAMGHLQFLLLTVRLWTFTGTKRQKNRMEITDPYGWANVTNCCNKQVICLINWPIWTRTWTCSI